MILTFFALFTQCIASYSWLRPVEQVGFSLGFGSLVIAVVSVLAVCTLDLKAAVLRG